MAWLNLPRVEGESSRQAHVDLPPDSYERELGRDGFFGPATQMYHRHPPTGWQQIDGPLRPHAFDTRDLPKTMQSPWDADLLLGNAVVKIRMLNMTESMQHLVRNADGDELLFIHQGSGDLFCDYGHLVVNEGDYIVLPRGTLWRLQVAEPVCALMIEASDDRYQLPDKGLVGQQAIFDPAMLEPPVIDQAFLDQQDEQSWSVHVKRSNQLTRIEYPFNPLDAVGWHGQSMPLRINWRAIRPLMSHRYHVPPSAHTTFVANGFVVCTFVPRPMESEPGVLNVPFFHCNEDYDEVIFYHRGQFFSRDHMYPGMITLHPCGIPHGPHPKALKNAEQKLGQMTDDVAVMIDSRNALEISEQARTIEWGGYVDSWK